MAHLVFVHGVSTRKVVGDPSYDNGILARDRRFTDVAFKGGIVTITNPYWGEFGADPQWHLQSVPKFSSKYGALGGMGDEKVEGALYVAAQQDFPAVVAGLSVAALEAAEAKGDPVEFANAEALWAGAARYAAAREKPAWLAGLTSDQQFLDKLKAEAQALSGVADLGFGDDIKAAGDSLLGGLSNLVNGPLGKAGRETLTPKVAIFIGDVFRYLKDAGPRAKIRSKILEAIAAAAVAAKASGEPLILSGHSMGGVILYDLLSDPTAIAELDAAIGAPFSADLLLTVGSQVALFEELKVFEASSAAHSAAKGKVPRPSRVKQWWNVFDKMDILSFLIEPVFDGVTDFAVDTVAGVKDAHGAYFTGMLFYARLNPRLAQAGLL